MATRIRGEGAKVDPVEEARQYLAEGFGDVTIIGKGWRPGPPLPTVQPSTPLPDVPDISHFDSSDVYQIIASFPAETARLSTDNYGDLKLSLGVHKLHKYDAMPLTDHPGMVLYIVAFAADPRLFRATDIEFDPFTPSEG